MTTMASQITSLTVVYSTVYSDTDKRKHQSSASLAFMWGIHRDRWIPAQRACYAENFSIWWRHHEQLFPQLCFRDGVSNTSIVHIQHQLHCMIYWCFDIIIIACGCNTKILILGRWISVREHNSITNLFVSRILHWSNVMTYNRCKFIGPWEYWPLHQNSYFQRHCHGSKNISNEMRPWELNVCRKPFVKWWCRQLHQPRL